MHRTVVLKPPGAGYLQGNVTESIEKQEAREWERNIYEKTRRNNQQRELAVAPASSCQ